MKRLLAYLLAALCFGALLFGWGYRRGAASVVVRTVTRVDTVFYERPQPVSISERQMTVDVPRILFVAQPRGDDDPTIDLSEKVDGGDSIMVPIVERTIEYRDSTYYARVIGPVVGTRAPRLDFMETYNTTRVQYVAKRSRFAVTAGVGVGYTPQGFRPTVGIQAGVVLWAK